MSSDEVAAQVTAALRCSALAVQLSSVYPDMLKQMVFPHPLPGHDRKDLLKYRKQLLDEELYSTLLVVWRELPFVLDEHLTQIGLGRHFSGAAMTAYGLATKIAESPGELAKVSSRIQSIAVAAEAYGLVERESSRAKMRPLSATELLHEFILKMTAAQELLISDFVRSTSLGNVGVGLSQQ